MPVTSSTSPGGPRPTPWMRSGCASSPSGRCCGPASRPHPRSGSCAPGAAPGAGRRAPKVLAERARTRLRAKLGPLEEAFTGFFTDQHAFLLAKMLARVDALDADLAELDAKIQERIAPFAGAAERLDEIPGVGQLAARLLLAELGTDMTR